MNQVATDYDPFDREADRELEAAAAAREQHQLWSFDQARRGRDAAHRETDATWIPRAPALPDPQDPRS